MIFGAERPQNDINGTQDATTEIKQDPTSHGDPAVDASDNTGPGSSAQCGIAFKSAPERRGWQVTLSQLPA